MIRKNHITKILNRIKAHHPEHAAAVDQALADPNILKQIQDKVKTDVPPVPAGHPILEWLWAHKDTIISIIMTIIQLLGAGS